jgi:metal-responsive CopG/Arc/MetJ family transcriptional regulator
MKTIERETGAKLMANRPVGQKMTTIGINMPEKMAKDIETRATSMHISKSKYVKIILQQWIDSGKKLTLSE